MGSSSTTSDSRRRCTGYSTTSDNWRKFLSCPVLPVRVRRCRNTMLAPPVMNCEEEVDMSMEAAMEAGCVRVVRKLRPGWKKSDIVLQRVERMVENVVYVAYLASSTSNEKLAVKVYNNGGESKNREVNMAEVFARSGLGCQVYSKFVNGY